MNRTKSNLLAATALVAFAGVMLAAPQVAKAQSTTAVLLPSAPASQTAECSNVSSTDTRAGAISANGSTVAGISSNIAGCPVVWVDGNPAIAPTGAFGLRGAEIFHVTSLSGDGRVIVGYSSRAERESYYLEAGGEIQAFANPAANQYIRLGGEVDSTGTYFALGSGSIVPGTSSDFRAWRWSQAGGYESLGSFGPQWDMFADAISGDGQKIAVDGLNREAPSATDGFHQVAGLWTPSTGLVRLPDLSASPVNGTEITYSRAFGISRDGSTIVGESRSADGLVQAAYWRGGQAFGLGYLPGAALPTDRFAFSVGTTRALAANADGSVVVGRSIGVTNNLAWRWTSASGMQDLNLFATNAGVNLGGFVLTDAVGLSDNGQYITGNSFNAAQSQSRGYVLSIAAAPPPASGTASFLPGLPGTEESVAPSSVHDLTADGSKVSGGSGTSIAIWNNSTPASINAGHNNELTRISGDGNSLLYFSATGADGSPTSRVYLWRQSGGISELATPDSRQTFTSTFDLDNSGGIALLNTYTYTGPTESSGDSRRLRAYRWSSTDGYQSLGEFAAPAANGPNSTLEYGIDGTAISGDNNIIAGNVVDRLNFHTGTPGINRDNQGAFRWTSGGGLQRLPDLAASPLGGTVASFSEVNGISRDGSTIVGASRGSDGLVQASFWRGGSVTGLGWLGAAPASTDQFASGVTQALAASADGSIIVGTALGNENDLAWRWTSASGMQDLNLFATNAGINLNGYVLNDAVGVSDNGQIIAGNADNGSQSRGYVLTFSAAPPPPPTTLTTSARLIVTLTLPGVTQTSIVNQTFSTQVDGLLNGSNLFTRTVGDQITGTLGVTALADARTALQRGSGLRRVVIGAPVLVSNTTTVLSSSSNTVNVASGTLVTNAAVVTNGPATVATGDLGTCATAATDGVNPTGCSLPGTPVAVNANVINTNSFTNTINSVTPTTTTTVNQLISAKWQVSATAGNQFGTVHALVGPAAFDRGDRLIGQLLGMGGGQGESANHVTRATMPMRNANALGGEGRGLTMFGGYFGSWSHIDADPTVPVASVKGRTNGFVMGLEKGLGAGRIGVAVDHGTSDYSVRDATYPETLKFNHTQLALFARWTGGGFSLNGAAAYGFGTAKTSLAMPVAPATAKRDVHGWSLGAQAGYTVPLGKAASVELVSGVRHTSANLKAFTETGGPSPLLGRDQTVTRTRVYGGTEAEAGLDLGGLTLTPRLHARVAHDSGDARGAADLVFASAPTGPVMTAVGPGVGRTVAELGGSLDAVLGGNVHLWVGYDGTFRNGAKAHAAKAGVTVAF